MLTQTTSEQSLTIRPNHVTALLSFVLKGGPGRRVLRAVCRISGSSHVITAWELGRGGLLRLTAYDPNTSMAYEARLSKVERACFGFDGEHRKSWIKHLGRRLSLRRATKISDAMEGAENRRDFLPARRTMVLDKTVFSTACRVAAGRIGASLFRMRAELVDAGKCLALILYQADTCKQCRVLLTDDDLVAVGLQPCTANAVEEQVDESGASDTFTNQRSEQDCKMTSMLVGPNRRDIIVRQLTRQLRFVPDSDSVTFSVNGDSRTTVLVNSIEAEQRRPQRSLKVALSQASRNAGSYATGHRGFVEDFLKRRHQPCVLLHGDGSARTRYFQEEVDSARPRYLSAVSNPAQEPLGVT